MKLEKRKMKGKIASSDCLTNPDAGVEISKTDLEPARAIFEPGGSLMQQQIEQLQGLLPKQE